MGGVACDRGRARVRRDGLSPLSPDVHTPFASAGGSSGSAGTTRCPGDHEGGQGGFPGAGTIEGTCSASSAVVPDSSHPRGFGPYKRLTTAVWGKVFASL